MKIILVNYRYFITGGSERYFFNVKGLLEKKGHTVIPFSVRHKLNLSSDYDKYFVSPIGKGDVTYFSESSKTDTREIGKYFSRMFYSFEVRRNFRKLITDTRPDIVYIIQYQNKLSPSFIGVAKKFKLPVIQRISDFGQICANQLFYNYAQKSVCEKCLSGSKLNAVKYRCVYNSAIYSLIKIMALKFHEILGITKEIDRFIIPSKFTSSKLVEFGFHESRIKHIPTFYADPEKKEAPCFVNIQYGNFALYIGRIEEEKGLMTLVKAFEGTDMSLKIIGDSSRGYDLTLRKYLENKSHNVEFLGRLPFEKIKEYLCKCAFTVCPSECYDNFPNSVIESFAFKKPVICTNIGSLREMVEQNSTGLLYEPFDHLQLRETCSFLFSNKEKLKRMGLEGRKKIDNELSESNHYDSLISLFQEILSLKSGAGIDVN
jgi:glycosyltransferase involved in cell wall biosynthesis